VVTSLRTLAYLALTALIASCGGGGGGGGEDAATDAEDDAADAATEEPSGSFTLDEEIRVERGEAFAIHIGPDGAITPDPVLASDLSANESDPLAATATTSAPPDTTPPFWPPGSTLTATDVTDTSLTLTWTAAEDDVGVESYTVFQDGTEIGTTGALTLDVTGLSPETTYTFSVEASDAEGRERKPVRSVQTSDKKDYCRGH